MSTTRKSQSARFSLSSNRLNVAKSADEVQETKVANANSRLAFGV